MTEYNFKDFATDRNGDLIIEGGDIKVGEEPDSLADAVSFRAITDPSEWTNDPIAVAGLKRFIGRPKTPELYDEIELELRNAITARGFIPDSDVVVAFLEVANRPNLVKITITVNNITYLGLDNITVYNKSVVCHFSLDTMSGKLTFIDDLF